MRPNAWKEYSWHLLALLQGNLGGVDGGHHTTLFFFPFSLILPTIKNSHKLFSFFFLFAATARPLESENALSTPGGGFMLLEMHLFDSSLTSARHLSSLPSSHSSFHCSSPLPLPPPLPKHRPSPIPSLRTTHCLFLISHFSFSHFPFFFSHIR